MNDERDFAEKTDPPRSPLDQVFDEYDRGPQQPGVIQGANYPHPYQGHPPTPHNGPSDLGIVANFLAAGAHVPFCLIGVIVSIIILVAIKDNKLARFYAIQSLLLHGTFIVSYIAAFLVMLAGGAADLPVLSMVGAVLYIVIVFGALGLFLVSIVMALLGKIFKIPPIGWWADKWSN